ncbi:cytochrome c [Candidatus Kirkpatrickella diaphorinae]|uniref:Cytochrome c n=1 Tax=Candidatus Kirkpatrickella diaphorinae TaxID=2984322 RepID=A0ABY6GL04_9PROT|nr:cytochrome c [Candidatus Kirkpatrickella diaphorinae]UYH52002.1 cytochrome c [Candidatus Kirkpatrickella diaphorinae]
MRSLRLIGVNALSRLISGVVACAPLIAAAASAGTDHQALMARGAYIAREADCEACHIGPDGTPYAGGKAIHSPLGAIIAPNITPSKTFGIGGWDEAAFAKAIRHGVSPHGHLYPAMPYTSYAGMSDQDVHALFTYLKNNVTAIDAAPTVETRLPFPFNVRSLMAGWNWLFARGRPVDDARDQPGSVARGRYLVDVMGHCSACHSPRNSLLGEDKRRYLGGAVVGGWYAPNITSDEISGIGAWRDDELFTFLKTGAVHGKAQASGGMAEAIEHGLSHLSDDDLYGIVRYLKTVPPLRDAGQREPAFARHPRQELTFEALHLGASRAAGALSDNSSLNGEQIFIGACASCHQLNGAGTRDQFYPSLFANTATGGITPRNLVMSILTGVHREVDGHIVSMPHFADELSDAQVAAVSNYVLQRFGNAALSVSAADVDKFRRGDDRPLLMTMFMRLGGISGSGGLAAAGVAALAWLERRARQRKFAEAEMSLPPDA